MQDARNVFCRIAYIVEENTQGFCESLLDEAQNMAIFSDEFTIHEQFLKRRQGTACPHYGWGYDGRGEHYLWPRLEPRRVV